jgi:hypothetical protein
MLESYARDIRDGFPFLRMPDGAHGLLIVAVYTIGSGKKLNLVFVCDSFNFETFRRQSYLTQAGTVLNDAASIQLLDSLFEQYAWELDVESPSALFFTFGQFVMLSLIFATITFIFLEYLPGDRRGSIRRNIFSISVVLAIGIMVGNGQYTVCQREGVTTYNILNTNSIDYNSYGTIWCRTYYFSSHESHESIFNITNLTPRIMTKLEMTELAKSLGHKQAIEFFKPHGLNLYRYVFALEAQIQSDGTRSEGRTIQMRPRIWYQG